jgi:[ribosomal protein S5]-alanine N-acetyltransferase
MLSKMTLENENILLRPIYKNDLNNFISLVTGPAFGKFSPFGDITPERADLLIDDLIKNYYKKFFTFWTVLDKKTQRYAGFTGHHPVSFDNKNYEMFFMGLYPKYWIKDFASQAAALTCNYAFQHEGVSEVIAFVHPEDKGSLECAKNLGGQLEKEALFFGVSVYLYSLDKHKLQHIDNPVISSHPLPT